MNFAGQAEVFSRGIRPNGVKSTWSNIQVNGWGAYPESITGGPTYADNVATFAFADGLPSYLNGDPRFPGFQALTAGEQDALSAAFASWSAVDHAFTFLSTEPGTGNDAAETMVFKAALASDDLLVFAPGENEGGDLIINTNSPLMSDLTPGKQGYFEVLRAIGTLRGLTATTEFGRDQSVMGTRSGGIFDSLPFASTPLPLDIRGVRHPSDSSIHYDAKPGSLYLLRGPDPFFEVIADAIYSQSIGIWITAEGSTLPNSIDLRPGKRSFSIAADGSTPHTFVNSFYSLILNGAGGEANDGLTGNQHGNALYGLGGNDVLRGGGGDDLLLGGAGDDYYIFRPGYGFDTIRESGGGVDVLRIEGMSDLDSLADDITFERFGNELRIRLEMDGGQDVAGDLIEVFGMSNPDSRVEAMTLLNPSGAVVRVSLVSVFDQLTSGRQRFQIAAGQDQYGQLVSPV
jgi:hypothetical protein